MAVTEFAEGGYRFLPGGQFSNGVAAAPGFGLRRLRFRRPLPLAEGFAAARALMQTEGRPPGALAACELRSPAPFEMPAFLAFNDRYLGLLRAAGFPAAPPYPVARSNLAPIFAPPAEPVLAAVTYSVPVGGAGGTDFLISGKPENREGEAWPGNIVAGADTSAAGLREKADYVMAVLRSRVAELGGDWAAITAAQVYTVHALDPVLDTVAARGALAAPGLTLVPAHPPVVGLAFEVDVRSVSEERFV